MKILDKYIFDLILRSSAATLIALVFLFGFFQFIEELKELNNEAYGINTALEYILLLVPSYAKELLVLSLMIGTILTIGKLNSNKELQIYLSASLSVNSIVKKTVKYPVYILFFMMIVFELITPTTSSYANQMKSEAKGVSIHTEANKAWLKKDNDIFLINRDQNSKYLINVFTVKDNELASFTNGKSAQFSNSKLVSNDSKKIEIQNGNIRFFSDVETVLNLHKDETSIISTNVKNMFFFELLDKIVSSYKNEVSAKDFVLEFITRIVKPFTLIGMILLAVPYMLDLNRGISIGNRVFLALVIGTSTHLVTKILSVISLKYESLILIGPFLPSLFLILIGLTIMKIKL